jgi:hypothetical protein
MPDNRSLELEFQTLPNVGPAIAKKLVRLGLRGVAELADRDPDQMFEQLSEMDGISHDQCLRDVFHAVVAHAKGEPALPWWHFSRIRKATEKRSR